jgi:hypothetical protein
MPIIGQKYLSTDIALGGTSVLILVSVALETLRAIESRALMVTYDQYEQPDYFYEPTVAGTAARRLRWVPRLPRLKRRSKK